MLTFVPEDSRRARGITFLIWSEPKGHTIHSSRRLETLKLGSKGSGDSVLVLMHVSLHIYYVPIYSVPVHSYMHRPHPQIICSGLDSAPTATAHVQNVLHSETKSKVHPTKKISPVGTQRGEIALQHTLLHYVHLYSCSVAIRKLRISSSDSESESRSKAPPPKKVKACTGVATYSTKYNPGWQTDFPFVSCGHHDAYSFYCNVCKKDVSCWHQGVRLALWGNMSWEAFRAKFGRDESICCTVVDQDSAASFSSLSMQEVRETGHKVFQQRFRYRVGQEQWLIAPCSPETAS